MIKRRRRCSYSEHWVSGQQLKCRVTAAIQPFPCHCLPVMSSRGSCAVQVPYRLLKAFHKIHPRLVRELEKKFSGKDVVIIANRRIMAPTSSGQSNARPRSRTLTAVHEETLLDLCYPTGPSLRRSRFDRAACILLLPALHTVVLAKSASGLLLLRVQCAAL